MKTIAIFGGAFDPVHRGHVELGHIVSDFYDEIWFMPCYKHKFDKNMTPPDIRLEILHLIEKENKKFKIFDYEIKNKLMLGSKKIIDKIKNEFKDINFYFVIGSDNALSIDKWEDGEILKKEVNFLIIPRINYMPNGDEWFTKSPHRYINVFPSDISSTTIRNQIKNKQYEQVKKLLPNKETFDYIISKQLYS
jgi:nicotinate-nucleotide adenylyltransferase